MEKSYYKSPVGILEIICENDALVFLKLVDEIKNDTVETSFIKNVKLQLDEYFSEKRKTFDIKITPKGTAFQKQVWQELQKIPYGESKFYSEIAESIGNKNAQRAIGSACNKNPILLVIPCHRVISKSGDIGGFAYGRKAKLELLKLENCVEMIQ